MSVMSNGEVRPMIDFVGDVDRPVSVPVSDPGCLTPQPRAVPARASHHEAVLSHESQNMSLSLFDSQDPSQHCLTPATRHGPCDAHSTCHGVRLFIDETVEHHTATLLAPFVCVSRLQARVQQMHYLRNL